MAKRKYIYCWNCGLKNSIADEKCTKCKKRLLDEDENEVGAFIRDKVIGKAKDQGEDIFKKKFQDFVGRRLFGILLSASVVFTGASITANILNKNKEPQVIHTQVQKPYTFEAMLEAHDETCEEGFDLSDGTCIRSIENPAERSLSCENGYTLSGNSCLQEVAKEEVKECIIPPDFVYSGDACTPLEVTYVEKPNEIFKTHCMVSANEWVDTTDAEGNPIRKCNNGGVVNFIDPTISLKCPSGTTEQTGKCYNTSKPKESFYCKEGKLEGKKCITIKTGKLSGKCDEGYEYNETVRLCLKK